MANPYPPLVNANLIHQDQLTFLEKLATTVAKRIGSLGFFFLILCWTLIWLFWNILGPTELRFDPYPAFVLWIFISNLIQIHLLPLIMISQNIQSRHAEIRTELDYATDQKSEAQIEAILARLDKQEKILQDILKSTTRH